MPAPTEEDLRPMLSLLDQMIEQQRGKVLKVARQLNPRLTPDDIMNPFDWPEVAGNPQFNFEDGLLAGLLASQAAILRQVRNPGEDASTTRLTP